MLEKILDKHIIAIVRNVNESQIVELGKALCDGGIQFIEVTFAHRSREGKNNTVSCLKKLQLNFDESNLTVGCGTVLDPKEVELSYQLGAKYIVTPNVNEAVIERAKAYGMLVVCGAFTPTEIEKAYSCGADIVKLFPASVCGVPYIKALQGPLGHIPLAAVGGIDLDNIREYIQAGVQCFGLGGSLIDKELLAKADYKGITERAKSFLGCF